MSKTCNLYFINTRGEYRCLRERVSESEAVSLIHKFLDEHDFKSYYTRTWTIDKGKIYDVGSHTEFFLWGCEK